MTTAGYSGKPLDQKLGFKPGDEVFVLITPDWYSDFADKIGFEITPDLPANNAHIFCEKLSELTEFLKDYNLNDIDKSLWVSWPKKASGIKTDLTEQSFRDAILPLGWVDIKVAAIDDTWSGLKFTRRKKLT
ncbi:MAG TPA: hypothetical protein VLF39_02585 [Candidatus Saccharimonadales bacterium]|nr:hypothetical protein [Candidatus Saccharimonadales bacterium]